jgi:hypothetical protein
MEQESVMSSKLREALLKADVLVSIATFEEGVKMDEVDKIRSEIKTALALPRRNCDVGTAEEQSVRFYDYCLTNSKDSVFCLECPLCNKSEMCEFVWAQMPYEKEGEA